MKKVDTHAHVFSADGPVVADARYQPGYSATPQAYIAHLDQHDFDYGVLIQPSFLGYDNSQMLAAIALYPQRLKGVAVVPETMALSEMRQLKQQGIVGVRLNLFGKAVPDLTQRNWQAFLANIQELGWQLELHCPPAYLVLMMPALQHHKAPIVLDHFGRIDPELGLNDPDYQAVLDGLDPERYWIKVSGFYRLATGEQAKTTAHAALEILLEKRLEHRLIWGSDWPHTQHESQISYDTAIQFMQQLLPEPDLRQQVLGHNALQLFDFAS